MNSKALMDTLRRDASYVGYGIMTLVVLGFAGLAIASALFDLMAIR